METGRRPDYGVYAAVDVHYLSTGAAHHKPQAPALQNLTSRIAADADTLRAGLDA